MNEKRHPKNSATRATYPYVTGGISKAILRVTTRGELPKFVKSLCGLGTHKKIFQKEIAPFLDVQREWERKKKRRSSRKR